MNVRHAKLHDVYGRAAKCGGFTFVPANLELDGNGFQSAFHLRDLPSGRIPPVLRVPVEQQYDVAWVRARLPYVFGISPEPTELEKALLAESFVAVRDGANEGIGFEVSDYYGKTSITFSPEETDEPAKQEITDAFWELMLSEPDLLADFQARVFHPGACIWLHYGCEDGEPFCDESDPGDDE